ncbi:hypothetical protein AB0D08_17900 [Kitasatospora sp. NPDC048540]|uniref:hypothetical protein n=1 Tax=Kitasatospora sp. NPDC048540 TaxID=3155634 RepID=UPI0033F4B151
MKRPYASAAALLAAAAVLLAGYLVVADRTSTPARPRPKPSPAPGATAAAGSWIISGRTLGRLLAADPTGRTTARSFDTPDAYVLTGDGNWAVPDGWRSTPTASFDSYTALESALTGNRLDPRIRAVLYDNEHWPQTPAAEQADPVRYDRMAADLVHRHHLLFIAAPATDLVEALRPGTASGAFDTFLKLGLAGEIARDADVLDLQAQGAEDNPTLFASFVAAATAQARRANPRIKVLAGLSTNPSGRAVGAAQIDRAARAVRSTVDGYWLNDPAASAACPGCTGPYPRTALDTLRGLGEEPREPAPAPAPTGSGTGTG